jgi:hypothetical protein
MDQAIRPDGWTTEDSSLLLELQSMWQGKYTVNVGSDGVWSAERIGRTEVITADSGPELRIMLTRDAINWNREIHGSGR